MSALHRLAREAGLAIGWKDAAGDKKRVSDETLVNILDALGLPASSEAAIRDSRARIKAEAAGDFITADAGESFTLPGGRTGVIHEPGYHEIDGITVAVAPPRCFSVADAAPGRSIWGPAVQIPSLRDRRGEAFGDFGALARFAEAAAEKGADALAISPVHALFPSDPSRFSPYAPSTRLFLNVLLADPSLLGDVRAEESGPLIDWEAAIPARMERLRALYDSRSDAVRADVAAFAREGGEELERHARYDALHAHYRSGGWQSWPSEMHDPAGAAVAAFARSNEEEVGFYIFLQWLADKSLAAAQAAGKDKGMAVGLIADLAVGMDAGGSHAWSRRDYLLTGLSVGAPPDLLGPAGQDWGITTFSPSGLRRSGFADFIATMRAALRHAGGIRIDHAMSLKRLWVVPHGASAKEGAYLAYPQQDLMRLLALESWRAKAIVVGEDLGTVPPGFREAMDERGMMGMRVLWFERTGKGGFTAPGNWSRHAAAMTSTHDLPTVAGWWAERDIDWTWKIGRTSPYETEAEEREARAKDRARLTSAFRKAGLDAADPVDAAVAFVAGAPSDIAIIAAEDLLGETEQPNLPGTTDEHPNWRRRLPGDAEDMLEGVAGRIAAINKARRA